MEPRRLPPTRPPWRARRALAKIAGESNLPDPCCQLGHGAGTGSRSMINTSLMRLLGAPVEIRARRLARAFLAQTKRAASRRPPSSWPIASTARPRLPGSRAARSPRRCGETGLDRRVADVTGWFRFPPRCRFLRHRARVNREGCRPVLAPGVAPVGPASPVRSSYGCCPWLSSPSIGAARPREGYPAGGDFPSTPASVRRKRRPTGSHREAARPGPARTRSAKPQALRLWPRLPACPARN